MEINANIYIITDSRELMEKATAILSRETDAFFPWETIEGRFSESLDGEQDHSGVLIS